MTEPVNGPLDGPLETAWTEPDHAPEPPHDQSGARVWLVPTPVGNLGDITLRALEVLRAADAVACEDTRRTGALLTHLGIRKPLVRLDAHTMNRAPQVLERHPRLAYVSDAGTPGISDPGAELVQAALAADVPVEVLPGPTALVPALVLSGLPAGRFAFEGFLPRAGRDRRERLAAVAAREETSVLYESPHRLHDTLQDLAAACGETRPASVTRELSKRFEETARGTLAELAAHFEGGVRGEIVVVVAGRDPAEAAQGPDFAALAQTLAEAGHSVRDIREQLQRQGLRKNDAYTLALQATGSASDRSTD
ncbi:16S rRNA (cytidine(1402)-2'-O)-methyltransferase [Deinococcus multiflagellatus]|uniref:Ribosomal RNA small subunit methyltransferase I n=1 Tax=Deinococcus multiflagellatus TaxID=1656887 RepID=A0ABW1ZGK6_9DEIO|nr:16S rRNA (cytidine(1402)-2'-O)-methyltransferase [Deinococcus multiflagellatus]MBZ9711969.1 16S rRNA (cytidine(1402)-2'-O)-methyltransferase [Deinococcus multiflagellatus]